MWSLQMCRREGGPRFGYGIADVAPLSVFGRVSVVEGGSVTSGLGPASHLAEEAEEYTGAASTHLGGGSSCILAYSDSGDRPHRVTSLLARGSTLCLRTADISARRLSSQRLNLGSGGGAASVAVVPVTSHAGTEEEDEAVIAVEDAPNESDARPSTCSIYSAHWNRMSFTPFEDSDADPQLPWRLQKLDPTSHGTAAALSSASIQLISLPNGGSQATISQYHSFSLPIAVRAVCMDAWGPHATVVGFSDGHLRVYDWRQGGTLGEACLTVAVPQPPWLRPLSRGRSAAATPAGTCAAGALSCCALQESYRVVCGLGDQRGTLVVSDLRYDQPTSAGGPQKKRLRSGSAAALAAAQTSDLLAGGWSVPTGRSICDVRHFPGCFGSVGFVDSTGRAAVTSISALEAAAQQCKQLMASSRRDYRSVVTPLFQDLGGGGGERTTTGGAPCWRTPNELPSPSRVAEIISGQEGGFGLYGTPGRHSSLQLRCAFVGVDSADAVFVHSQLTPGSFGLQGVMRPRGIQVGLVEGPQGVSGTSPFVSVSSVENVLCLDSVDGKSYCAMLNV